MKRIEWNQDQKAETKTQGETQKRTEENRREKKRKEEKPVSNWEKTIRERQKAVQQKAEDEMDSI